jgi:hypothetical protein
MMDERRQDSNCRDCVYSMLLSLPRGGIWHACDYMGITGKRRPCDGGDNCTVKIKKGDKNERVQ